MSRLRLVYPLPLLCRALGVSRSGYYSWITRRPSKRAREEARLEAEIRAAHTRTRQTCGPERLQKDLATHDVHVGISRIRRIRKKLGIRCKQGKKFKATTDSSHLEHSAQLSDDWRCRGSNFDGIIHEITEGSVSPLDEGVLVPAVDIAEVLSLHDQPYPLNGVEVW